MQLPENARDRVAVLVLTTANPAVNISDVCITLMFHKVDDSRDVVRIPARPNTHL